MAKFSTLPKVDLPAGGTPAEVNQYYALDATQSCTEIQTIINNVGITPTDSDTSQVSKSVSRYAMANMFIESAGSSHSGAADLYIAIRPVAAVTTSMKIPTTFIEGSFFFKASAANQSNNVQFQLNTNSAVVFKKLNMNGQLIDLDVGDIVADDIISVHLDLANNIAILKRTLSSDEVEGLVGKFNIKETLDFTASAPVASTIGYKYINTTTGVISDGYVGAGTDTAVTENKIYQLYDDGTPYRWYEIDAEDGMLAFDEDTDSLKLYNGSAWNTIGGATIEVDDLQINNKFNTQITSQAISSGAIAYTGYATSITGEGAAADTLTDITGGIAGDRLTIYCGTGYTITIAHNESKINLTANQDIYMRNGDILDLICIGSNIWLEIADSLLDNANIRDKYYIYGFVSSSGSDTDEEIDVTAGKAICEDGMTIIEAGATTDLNLPTEFGGALTGDTTYHVYRYQRATDQAWHVEDSLTPTIGDIRNALAYRRIASFKTDASGDLYDFEGEVLPSGGIEINYVSDILDLNASNPAVAGSINLTLSAPSGLPLRAKVLGSIAAGSGTGDSLGVNFSSVGLSVATRGAGFEDLNSRGDAERYPNMQKYIKLNTSSQIVYEVTSSTINNTLKFYTKGYQDYRNYF